MDFSLDNNVNKIVLLLILGVVGLLVINMNKKMLGETVSTILSIGIVLVCGFFGNQLINDTNESFYNPNEQLPPSKLYENFENNDDHEEEYEEELPHYEEKDETESQNNIENFQNNNNNVNPSVNSVPTEVLQKESAPNQVNVQDMFNDNNSFLNNLDLLPSSETTVHTQSSPNTPGELNTKNLLNAGHHIGVNTQGCSLRNANRGLRSEPPNPQVQVSPWLQTTICPDLYRKPLEGGVESQVGDSPQMSEPFGIGGVGGANL